jgi:dTDP-4-dehydrorhamnose reductase
MTANERLLVTGGSGLLGCNLAKLASNRFDTYATYRTNSFEFSNVTSFHAELTADDDLKRIVDINPDVIVHCAAETDVDYCERHPEEAAASNVITTENVTRIARDVDAFLIHISTDAVFDGGRGNYSETDEPNPINTYGRSKLRAEASALDSHDRGAVVRTNIYGWNALDRQSLAEWMIQTLRDGHELPAIEDAVFSPILVNHLVGYLFALYQSEICGLVHIAGEENCTKLEFAEEIADVFKLNANLIRPICLSELDLYANRGADLSMDTSSARRLFGEPLPTVREGLIRMRNLEKAGYLSELRVGGY